MENKEKFKEPRFCKLDDCGTFHDGAQVKRSLGKESAPYLYGFCCARCYTKHIMNLKTPPKKFIYVTIEEFIKYGGALLEGREIYHEPDELIGTFVKIDDKTNVPLITNGTFKTCPIPYTFYVKIEVTPTYK